jgi:hypothetical protein
VQVVTVVLPLLEVMRGLGTSLTDVASDGVPHTDGSRTNGRAPDGDGEPAVGVADPEEVSVGVAEVTGDGALDGCWEPAPNGRPWDGLPPKPELT